MQTETPPPAAAVPRRGAPGSLELVRQFLNTADIYAGDDELVDLAALTRWLRKHGLIAAREKLRAGDLERALGVREALRSLLERRDRAQAVDPAAVRALNGLAPAALSRVAFDRDGQPLLEPVAAGLDGALAQILAAVAVASVEGTWGRLKVCADHRCLWAFYDASKNHSRSWCNMAVCGNRAKARQYRERHRSKAGGEKQ